MAVEGLSREEKERILKALEVDREFRYALMGLLGFREVLERITRLEERFAELEKHFARLEERQQKLEERFAELEEHFARLEERQQRLEERFAELEERYQLLEERFAKLEERFAQLEERFAKLEERVARLEERFAQLEERFVRLEERLVELERRHEERLEKLERTLQTVAHRFGVMSEEAFREALKDLLERYFGATAHRWSVYDSEGIVYGHPSVVEVDVVVRDNVHILVELKSRIDTGDVLEITRIAKLYEKREGVKPALVLIGGWADKKARELAGKLGVRIYTYLEEG